MVYGTFAQLITEVTTLWIMKMAGSPVTRHTRHRISGCNTGYWRDITFQLQQIDVQKIHVLSRFSYYNHKYRHISALQGYKVDSLERAASPLTVLHLGQYFRCVHSNWRDATALLQY